MHQHTAQGLASLGRNGDSMLVHMTPREVAGLQSLALAHGGSLTINPKTGLPEASFLSSLLPMALGFALGPAGFGLASSALEAGLMVGGGAGLLSGDWRQGLKAGLGAFGGAGMGESLLNIGDTALRDKAVADTATANITNYGPLAGEGVDNVQRLADFNAAKEAAASRALDNVDTWDRLGAGASRATGSMEGLKEYGKAYSDALGGKWGVMAAAAPTAYDITKGLATPPAGVAPASQTKGNIRTYGYRPGNVNPNFGKPGEPYYLDQGYDLLSIRPAAAGGLISPNDNVAYPMSNLATGKAGFNVQSSPTANEVVGGYDARIDPSTGAQMMAEGGLASFKMYNDTSLSPTRNRIKQLSNAQLDLTAEESDNPEEQGEAVIERYLRGATQRTPKSTYTRGMAGGGVLSQLDIGGGQPVNTIPQYTYNPDEQTYAQVAGSPSRSVDAAFQDPGFLAQFGRLAEYGNPFAVRPILEDVARQARGGMAAGGIASLPEYAAGGKLLRGAGDGMSDDIPAVIRGAKTQRAALADGEFVVPADVVSHLGNGSTEAGAKRLYSMMNQVRKARTGNPKQGKQIQAEKYMPA